MDRVKNQSVTHAREFFTDQLRDVMSKQQISVNPESFNYLINLLLYYMNSDHFFVKHETGKLGHNVLFHLYRDYLHGNAEAKRAALKRLGDICLLVTGFFADSLNRKLVDIDYYFGMGGTAYWQLSSLALNSTMFKELSVKFKHLSNVLVEMSERSGLQSNSDLLRVYEKWLLTGSDRLKALLSEHGIMTSINVDVKTKH